MCTLHSFHAGNTGLKGFEGMLCKFPIKCWTRPTLDVGAGQATRCDTRKDGEHALQGGDPASG